MTPAAQRFVDIVDRYVGCSLKSRRGELAALIGRGVDGPSVVTIKTNCALFALGVMHEAGVDHPLLKRKYQIGMAVTWVCRIGRDLGAMVRGVRPTAGCLMRYCTPGRSNDHLEWCMTDPDEQGHAVHAGGGRPQNAITRSGGTVLWSSGRPLIEIWKPELLLPEVT